MSRRIMFIVMSSFVLFALAFVFFINTIDDSLLNFDVSGKLNVALEHSGAKIIPAKPVQDSAFQDLVRFTYDDCPLPYLAMPINLNIVSDSLVAGIKELKAGRYLRYNAYLGDLTEPQNRILLHLRRLKYSLLYLIGRSPYVPAYYPIYLMVPDGCKIDGRIDWKSIWTI